MGWVDKATLRPLYPRERDPLPIVQEGRWAVGPVWTDVEKVALAGIRYPFRPARSELQYRVRYRGPHWNHAPNQNTENLRRICLEQQVNRRRALCLR